MTIIVPPRNVLLVKKTIVVLVPRGFEQLDRGALLPGGTPQEGSPRIGTGRASQGGQEDVPLLDDARSHRSRSSAREEVPPTPTTHGTTEDGRKVCTAPSGVKHTLPQ